MQRRKAARSRPAEGTGATAIRAVLLTIAGATAVAGARPAGAQDAITCDTGLPASSMRFFDGHDHLPDITNAAEGETKLDELAMEGVSLGMLALATPDPIANEAALDMQSSSAYPVFAFARAPTVLVEGEKAFNSTTFDIVVAQLQDGATGVGEMTMRHSGPPGLAADIPADDPIAMAIYAEAGTRGVPVSIHFEIRDKSAPGVDITSRIEELRAALTANPETRFLWAHAGDTGPVAVRALMDDFDNLYADISTRNPSYIRGWPMGLQSLGAGSTGTGSLKPEWKSLFEDHADRFVFGLDLASEDREEQLSDVMIFYRGILGELSQATAENIACKNARALLTTPALPGPSGPWLGLLVLLLLGAGIAGMKRAHAPV